MTSEIDIPVTVVGGVVISATQKVLLCRTSHAQEGVVWTFPRTKLKLNETQQQAAIRAARERTGYDARVRVALSGFYQSPGSKSAYYLMDAKNPPAPQSEEIAELRWVRLTHACEMFRESANEEIRRQDLTLIKAAKNGLELIPFRNHARVQPEDRRTLGEMSDRQHILHPARAYSADDMRKIVRGFYPTVMEQKWFIYFTGNRLRLHRSWTGDLYFDVGFEMKTDDSAEITEVIINLGVHGSDYQLNDDKALEMLDEVIRYCLLEPLEKPAV